MDASPDAQLISRYAEFRDEAAFREIVARHTDFVYSAALRQVESSAVAGDLAQDVFTDLARKAASVAQKLSAESSLAGWLCRATRYAALNHLRAVRRRSDNERQAMQHIFINSESHGDWEQIRPLLDEALDTLADDEREAVLLRYFQKRDYRAVGFALGVSDDAAQKRVSRAVERLREFFSKHNVTIGASGLVILISANAVQSAPIGLAATISAAAFLTGTTVSISTVIAATKTIAMTTIQKSLIAATLAVVAGTGVFEAHQAAQLRAQNQILQQQQTPLAEQIRQLQHERDDATNRLTDLLAEDSRLKLNLNQNELLKLRGEVGVLRAQLTEANNAKTQLNQAPLSSALEYFNRAERHQMNHEYEAQLDDLNKAIELDPNMAEAYLQRGDLYSMNLPKERGGREKAVADLTRCLELRPNDLSARWNRANAYAELGQYDNAIADWTALIEGDSDYSRQVDGKTKTIAQEYFWRGHTYQNYKRDYSKAIADYTSALQTNPQIEDAHRLRGQCYELLGETEKAQQDFVIEPKRN